MDEIRNEMVECMLEKLIVNLEKKNAIDPITYAVACLDAWQIIGDLIERKKIDEKEGTK